MAKKPPTNVQTDVGVPKRSGFVELEPELKPVEPPVKLSTSAVVPTAWEYRVTTYEGEFNAKANVHVMDDQKTSEYLNSLGDEGWEVVFVTNTTGKLKIFMKRRKGQEVLL